ncbi:MAG TPA: hypothetical protein VG326_18100 [Tepidisphaeraceae bacterium]|jgi:hypothetical protein|nr:hypothetical protein [Tepidisphaeraceae bacterium]
MITHFRIAASVFALITCFNSHGAVAAHADLFANVKSQADLDAVIASTDDAALKQAARDNSAAILAAAERSPHVQAVMHTVEASPGKVEKVNATPPALKKAVGGDIAIFDTLRVVDLSIPNAGPHDARKVDPYDAAFFEHLGHIATLESLNIIQTKLSDEWIAPIGQLTNLKSLHFTNNGKLTDAGLEHLADLKQIESFGYVGTQMKGHAFAKFDGWTHLTNCSFRGSQIDDEGLRDLCDHFPNLQSISLAHAHFTDAGAVSLEKLTKLKGLEIASHQATPDALRHITGLPLEYLQVGEGFEGPAAIAIVKEIHTLRRLTLTDAKALTDADLKSVASMSHLESLEMSNLPLPDERLPLLESFSFVKSLRLVHRPQPYPAETQAKIKAMLPHTAVRFD